MLTNVGLLLGVGEGVGVGETGTIEPLASGVGRFQGVGLTLGNTTGPREVVGDGVMWLAVVLACGLGEEA